MKFRKKPVVIEAEEFCPGLNLHRQMQDHGIIERVPARETAHGTEPTGPARYFIPTLEGEMEVRPGDWVITGVKGEKYPCKPDIFAATYEPADKPVNPNADAVCALDGKPAVTYICIDHAKRLI